LTGKATDRTWKIAHDKTGLISKVDGPRSDVDDSLEYSFSQNGKFVTAKNSLGHEEHYLYDDQNRIKTITHAKGVISEYKRDSLGRVIEVISTSSLGASNSISISYDEDGRVGSISAPNEGVLSGFYYADGSKNSHGVKVLNRFKNFINPERSTHHLDYYLRLPSEGLSTDKISSLLSFNAENEEHIVHDKFGRISEIVNNSGKSTIIRYGKLGNISRIIDPRGNVTNFQFNGFGEKTLEKGHFAGAKSFKYDAAGNLIKQKLANGVNGSSY